MKERGAFVVYAKCGKHITGAALDFGPDPDTGDMVMEGLRNGCRVEYRTNTSGIQLSACTEDCA